MKKYIILTRNENTVAKSLIPSFSSNILDARGLTKHEFETYEEALDYAHSLNFGVKIYEVVAETEIDHKVKTYESDRTTTRKAKRDN